jgi:PAS domain S-box-containing protein
VQIQAATRDISDRKCFEEKLKKEVLLRDASLDALPNIFFMVDSDLNFVRWNKNLEENLGYSQQEIKMMRPADFFERKDHQEVKEKIQNVFVVGEEQIEAELVTKNGELIHHRINGRLFVEDNKKYIIGTCVDISRDHVMMNELKASNKEKQVLLLEIHHRVKNNLAMISGMLQLQAMESDDPVLGEKLTDSQMRVQSIASVHELLYQSESFSHLDMKKYLKNLTKMIVEANKLGKDILLVEDISTVKLNINQAIPCSLITNELITNAYKHAFKGRKDGKVTIKLTEVNEGDVQLIVEDNGSGLPEDIDFVQPKSIGLQLINVLKEQLKATLNVSKADEAGIRFCLTFKKQDIKGSSNGYI